MHPSPAKQPEAESFLNVNKTHKTTHSWPIICRQSNHYASEEEDDDDDDEDDDNEYDYDDGYINFNADNNEFDYDDSDDDSDTIFRRKTAIPSPATFLDNLSCRKYLVADYNPKQSNDYFTSTITSVVNAQSDFPISLKLNSSNSGRLTRNSIVPLMSPKSQTPRSSRAHEANVSAAINAAVSMDDQTTCIAPPPILFLLLTLVTTISATGLLCLAVMTDHWEIIRWDRNLLIT